MSASARGLFRATGAPPSRHVLPREADDFYPTPPEPVRALIRAEFEHLRRHPVLWEPAAGDGAMARELEDAGFRVVRSDLVERGCGAVVRDFYDFGGDAPARALVTNPPFQECNRDPGWVRHALEACGARYMALLLPLNWFGAAGRAALLADHPPARVYIMRWRIDWTGQGAPPMICAWVVWDAEHRGEAALRMLDRPGGPVAALAERVAA